MTKILLILITLINFAIASSQTIEKKIQSNKKILNKSDSRKVQTNLKIKRLANKIQSQNKNILELEKDIQKINGDIRNHQRLLENSKKKLSSLKNKSSNLMTEKKSSEVQIVDTISEEFSSSIALKLASKESLQELIDYEIYTILSQNSKDKILKLNNSYDILTNDSKVNKKRISKISTYIKKRKETKQTLNKLKSKHSKSLSSLESQHKSYQKELKRVIKQQESLKSLLSRLNILKRKEVRKEELKRKRLQELLAKKRAKSKSNTKKPIVNSQVRNEQFAQKLDLDVRKIGSSTAGVKITKYRGGKTIAPLKSFQVVKNFGTYYDPVYKIKLFNESIVLKTRKPKAKVVSVLNGKIVYAKKNAGMLENVVIVQHKNGLHTIYSHLDEIAPTLRVGKWIKKGYVVGRVNNNLTFQATKNSYHINPKDLFKI
jgi:murein DD-endopeptidase MepM/ murein hydrolase activator NlpD